MIGRIEETEHLSALFASSLFEYLVMYGRRRVGKTTILKDFSQKHNAVYFPAQEKNDALNLREFSKIIQLHFDKRFIAAFDDWQDAFTYFSLMCGALLILGGGTIFLLADKTAEYDFVRKPYMLALFVLTVDGIMAVCYMSHNPFAWIVYALTMLLLFVSVKRKC